MEDMHLYNQGEALGIWGMILGIISMIGWVIPPIAAVAGAIGILVGINGVESQNRSFCMAGLILNIIGFFMACLKALLVFVMT